MGLTRWSRKDMPYEFRILDEVPPRVRVTTVRGPKWEKAKCKAQQVAPGMAWCRGGMKLSPSGRSREALQAMGKAFYLIPNMMGSHGRL